MSDAEYPPPGPYPGPAGQAPGYPPGYPAYAPPPASAYAHWGQRVGAYLIDALLLVPGYVVASIGAALAGGDSGGASAVGALLMGRRARSRHRGVPPAPRVGRPGRTARTSSRRRP